MRNGESEELFPSRPCARAMFGGAYGRFDWISQFLDFFCALWRRRRRVRSLTIPCKRSGNGDRELWWPVPAQGGPSIFISLIPAFAGMIGSAGFEYASGEGRLAKLSDRGKS